MGTSASFCKTLFETERQTTRPAVPTTCETGVVARHGTLQGAQSKPTVREYTQGTEKRRTAGPFSLQPEIMSPVQRFPEVRSLT